MSPLLAIRDVVVDRGRIRALQGVSLDLWTGEVIGIAGESGSGKSTLLGAIAADHPVTSGSLSFQPDPAAPPIRIEALDEAGRRRLRPGLIGLMRQQAEDGLRMPVSAGGNIVEPLLVLGERRFAALRAAAGDWLERTEIPAGRLDDSPLSFSGGMRQRLQLARILAPGPRLVLLDEPTSSLDVSVQARLVDLIRDLVRRLQLSVIVVTHDLGVARILADRLMIMRHGRIVESGLTDQVLEDPQHPYTQDLVAAVMRP